LSVEHPLAGDELRAIKRYLAPRIDKLPWFEHLVFTSAALDIVTVAPLAIGLASAIRWAPPQREQVEGATALVTLGATSTFVVSLPPEPWATAVAVAVVLPMLWIAVRCRLVFVAAAAFIIVAVSTWTVLGQ
jgi:hypothetical protein